VIRFHPSLAWRERDGDPVIRVQAMIAAMRSIESNVFVAVSCRRLTPDGHKVGKPKFRGAAAGSAIKLDADETVTHGLHIGEGVESCMSARQLGLKPTWALGSTSNIAAFPVLSGIECLTILGENDDASAKAVEACGERWHAAGRIVLINRAAFGKDLNDALRGAA
jgi:putative DNA primase/helicase